MKKLFGLVVALLFAQSNIASAQDDILDFLPNIISAVVAVKSCSDGVYATCTNAAGCRAIDGLFSEGICVAKTRAQLLAEQFGGQWTAETSLDSGIFFSHLEFASNSLAKLPSAADFMLSGDSHPFTDFADSPSDPVVVSFDSQNNDWFILNFWGTDVGKIGLLEISQTSINQYDGCEFIVTYPDLTYADGVCYPVRLRRTGSRPGFITLITNLISDLGAYLSATQTRAQPSGTVPRITENRPTIDQIHGLRLLKTPLRDPLVITSPLNQQTTNSSIVAVSGSYVESINFDGVAVNDQAASSNAGGFEITLPTADSVLTISAVADYGRRNYSAQVLIEIDSDRPAVVGAASTSSSSVILQFTESMADDTIAQTSNFSIVRNDTGSILPVTSVDFADAGQTAVELQTGLQNNVQYRITAVNVRDTAGNPVLEPQPEVAVSLASANFVGTAPSGTEILDTDNDGLLDHVEIAGWPVIVQRTDGTFETTYVSSDPFLADTDGDGVPDAEERHGGLDPRNTDTDGDTLTDDDEWNRIYSDGTKQDTDGDGIQDGFEYSFFRTSPILADTDGDQIDDPTEVAAGNRNPLIADLPSPDINVGSVNLELDTRFTFTDVKGEVVSEGKTVESTLTQGEDQSFSKANETSTKNTIARSSELTRKLEVQKNFGISDGVASGSVNASITSTQKTEQGSERGSTTSFGEASSRASEESYHDSLSTSTERNFEETISREVVDAAMRVDLSIENAGDIPFSITNLELTALTQDPTDRRKMVPVASLVPENESLGSINIGALGDPSRGPFVFKTQTVFPQQIEQLMKNPRGLIVQLANFDIVDQDGNNFAFTSQSVLDRTAGITFDLGDGRTESFRVATASDHDANTGVPNGITMGRALEIIGLERHQTVRDGGNGRIDTVVVADDVAAALIGRPVEPGTVIIRAGANAVLDTTALGGDDFIVESDYATEPFIATPFIADGGNGIAESDVLGDDISQAVKGSAVQPAQMLIRAVGDLDSTAGGDDIVITPDAFRDVLVRLRDTQTDLDASKFWILFTQERTERIDLDDLVLRSGQQYDFTFVQDVDGDGVWAREEYLHGSSDLLPNSDGCSLPSPPVPCDTLTDFSEINEGWRVQLRSSPQSYKVFPNPNQADSDRDRLLDDQEKKCQVDPRLRDTDLDGLTDWEELFGRLIQPDGSDDDMLSIDPETNTLAHTITPYKGVSPGLIAHNSFDDCDVIVASQYTMMPGFATDPLNADTDGDFITDGDELKLGINPNDPLDGASFLDDDEDGLSNSQENTPRDVIINGTTVQVTSDPRNPNSDGDALPDLLEWYLMSNPRDPDTDGDGLGDSFEYKPDGEVYVTEAAGVLGILFKTRLNNTYQQFLSDCDAAPACDNTALVSLLNTIGSPQHGSNLSEQDTDFDGVLDPAELASRDITVNGAIVSLAAPSSFYYTSQSDTDGLSDGFEVNSLGTDPRNVDTDGDGGTDDYENATGLPYKRDPLVTDKIVRILFKEMNINWNDNEFRTTETDVLVNDVLQCTYRLTRDTKGVKVIPANFCNRPVAVLKPADTFSLRVESRIYVRSFAGGDFDTVVLSTCAGGADQQTTIDFTTSGEVVLPGLGNCGTFYSSTNLKFDITSQ